MNEILSLAGIVGVLIVGTVSPGPSFVMVARTAVSSGRGNGLAAAVGMGIGGVLFTVAALVGLQALLLSVPALYLVFKLAGGIYLAYLGVRIWRASRQALPVQAVAPGESSDTVTRSLVFGLGTQLSNPKAAIVYASIFAAFLPNGAGLAVGSVIAGLVFIIETAWYALVAVTLSAEKPRRTYLRFKSSIDRVAGAVMVALGLKLASSAPSL
ncbi:putative amino acid efflux protein [Aromatoleum aromaticum EbN1]|uniref:Amino acid efflux protein n=1 Tax=Aromatoleum aromaticum (strain DSM 19018 / LMG 30748 / EbN1) TaxID=76114 RepID=Q5NYI9_AROAE|nr:LysE family transporter [Aromatoleum aromaticum]CAI09875.1 putative amino acid efflux protein [Aromatoleum aromaticum EbN1]